MMIFSFTILFLFTSCGSYFYYRRQVNRRSKHYIWKQWIMYRPVCLLFQRVDAEYALKAATSPQEIQRAKKELNKIECTEKYDQLMKKAVHFHDTHQWKQAALLYENILSQRSNYPCAKAFLEEIRSDTNIIL